MISLVKIYREMFENKQKQANDLTKQLEDLRVENDALRQKNADLNNQILEHVKKCLYCENLNFTQEIKFLDHKISELREENARLKGLLKECKELIKRSFDDYPDSAIYRAINSAIGESEE